MNNRHVSYNEFFFGLIVLVIISFISCQSCSESGKRKMQRQTAPNRQEEYRDNKRGTKEVIKMTKFNGVYQVPIKVNSIPLYFIFDTGAALISISETEAKFLLKQGSLSREDFIGQANFIDAQGDISEGTIINLKEVIIGNRRLNNVRASIVHNLDAPLLLGQSALERFGKVTIDYKSEEIILE